MIVKSLLKLKLIAQDDTLIITVSVNYTLPLERLETRSSNLLSCKMGDIIPHQKSQTLKRDTSLCIKPITLNKLLQVAAMWWQ